MIEVNWSDDEIKLLISEYPIRSNEELSHRLGRSINSIQHKATRLGIHKNKETLFRVRSESRSGEKGSNWKGGRKKNKRGHLLVLRKGHPMADSQGYILEHRYIMAENIGRILEPGEVVHHINGIKTDNRIENLKLMSNAEHTILHHTGMKRSIETRERISQSKRRTI